MSPPLLRAGTVAGTVTGIDGVRLQMSDDRQLVDLSGIGHVLSIGHDLDEVRDAILENLSRSLVPGSGRIATFESAERLAELVVAQWGDPDALAYFAPSGTDAVELAIQFALHIQSIRGESRRTQVLGLRESYHGMSIAATSAAGHREHRERLASVLIPWPKLPPLSAPIEHWLTPEVERMFRRAAAVIIEPVGGTTSGAMLAPPGLWDLILRLARRHGCLVIADEVVTGFGRTGRPFQSEPRQPDLLISGKWLGGGYVAISALLLAGHIATELTGRMLPMRFTFANLAGACSIAEAVQSVVVRRNLIVESVQASTSLRSRIEDEIADRGIDAQVRGTGMLLAIECSTRNARTTLDRWREAARGQGTVAMFGSRVDIEGNERLHIMCTPPLDVDRSDVEALAQRIGDLIDG